MNPGRTGESHAMPGASYVGERSTPTRRKGPVHCAELDLERVALLGMQRVALHVVGKHMQQVVTPKPQSVHVDATLKVTMNVENAEAPVKNRELC